jgi:UDP-N-acetyl-D-glucosamine dehydrogenase
MKIGVIGLGYVGLPLAVAFSDEGHDVVGLDVDPRKIDALAEGRSCVGDVPSERLLALGRTPYLGLASVDLDAVLADADLVCIVTAHSAIDYRAWWTRRRWWSISAG